MTNSEYKDICCDFCCNFHCNAIFNFHLFSQFFTKIPLGNHPNARILAMLWPEILVYIYSKFIYIYITSQVHFTYFNTRISGRYAAKILALGWLASGILVKNCEKMVKIATKKWPFFFRKKQS